MSYTVIIPARYQSSRLPGKPLLDIAGKSMIQRVYEQALQSKAERVLIATDDQRIAEAAQQFGAEVVMTRDDHQSGTERLAEVCQLLKIGEQEIVVNVQGDEPLIPPVIIDQVAELLAKDKQSPMATLSVPLQSQEEVNNPNVVKVVSDANSRAIYFSRASIPFDRDQQHGLNIYSRHIGIYAYRAGFIQQYLDLEPSPLESIEHLEQLRVLWHGMKIGIQNALEVPKHGVDTEQDLAKVRAVFE